MLVWNEPLLLLHWQAVNDRHFTHTSLTSLPCMNLPRFPPFWGIPFSHFCHPQKHIWGGQKRGAGWYLLPRCGAPSQARLHWHPLCVCYQTTNTIMCVMLFNTVIYCIVVHFPLSNMCQPPWISVLEKRRDISKTNERLHSALESSSLAPPFFNLLSPQHFVLFDYCFLLPRLPAEAVYLSHVCLALNIHVENINKNL